MTRLRTCMLSPFLFDICWGHFSLPTSLPHPTLFVCSTPPLPSSTPLTTPNHTQHTRKTYTVWTLFLITTLHSFVSDWTAKRHRGSLWMKMYDVCLHFMSSSLSFLILSLSLPSLPSPPSSMILSKNHSVYCISVTLFVLTGSVLFFHLALSFVPLTLQHLTYFSYRSSSLPWIRSWIHLPTHSTSCATSVVIEQEQWWDVFVNCRDGTLLRSSASIVVLRVLKSGLWMSNLLSSLTLISWQFLLTLRWLLM